MPSCNHQQVQTRPGIHETPTIIPRQSGPVRPAHAREQLRSEHTRSEPKGLKDRERLSNAFRRPRKDREPHCRKVTTKDAQDALYVYYRHQESGKDVIPLQTHRERLPKQSFTIQPHDLQTDNKYMLSVPQRSCTMCLIKTMRPANWQPRNHNTRRSCEAMRKARSYL